MRLDRLLDTVRKSVPSAGRRAAGGTRKNQKRPPGRSRLDLELLEERLSPIVGSLAIPATVARGTFYDGVVALLGCSGSLLSSGRHILTAAHCIGGSNQVRFEMNRGATPINIFNNVPAGAAFQTNHPSYNGDIFRGFDVSVLRLTDQEPGFTGIANRHLVAPFGATRYDLYRATNEAGQIATLVGYGNTGTGSTGQTGGAGVKRLGYNHLTRDGSGWMAANPTTGLLSDFDDGSVGANRLSDPFWTGHSFEALAVAGDSGGPGFINNQIAGVHSGIWWYGATRGRWGDVILSARTSVMAGFIDGQVAGSYHLVLDMNQQVLGLDGLTENVTITAQRVGANIQLSVSAPAFSGVYYTAPASQILSLTVRGSGDHETINLETGLGLSTTVVGRGGNDTINVRGVSSATTMTVDAGTGNDIINVGNAGSVLGIQGTLILNGGSGTDTFNYLDQSNSFHDTYTVSGSSVGRTASSTVAYSNMDAVNVNAGTGNNTINVTSTAAGVTTTIDAGSGNDTINVSSSTLNLTQIAGNLTLQSGPGTDTLNINDQNNTLNHAYTLTSGSLQRTSAGLISYTGFNGGLTVRGGSGATTFLINSTHGWATTVFSGTGVNTTTVRATSAPLTIHGQNGLDTVNVGSTTNTLAAILGALTITNSSSYTTLVLNDQGTAAARIVTLTNAAITGLAPAAINYTAADLRQLVVHAGSGGNTFHVLSTPISGNFLDTTLNTGAGGDTVNVRATTGPLVVNGGNGNDTITVGSGGAGSTINAILGAVTVNGQANSDTLIVDDRGHAVNSTYTITATTVSRTGGPATITYGTLESLALNAGTQNDTITVAALPALPVTVDGGGGNDSMDGPNTDNSWYISGLDQGTLNGTLSFSALENLGGGTAADTFRFADGQGVSGVIWGGDGTDTLDYTAYSTGVYVWLLYNAATGAVWVGAIENVYGGTADDYLRGDDLDNSIVGNEGNDVIVGHDGSDYLDGSGGRDLIIGGWVGYDYLLGGDGEDILIDGVTNYDSDDAALSEIMLEWTRTDLDYEPRALNLAFGGGFSTYLLDASNVFNDGTPDELYGQGDLDWFWADAIDLTDQDPSTEFLN